MQLRYRLFLIFPLLFSLLTACADTEALVPRYWLGTALPSEERPVQWHEWQERGRMMPNILPAELQTQSPFIQLEWVQNRANAQPFYTDKALWGREDYWSVPTEFFAYGGDCEDYALAKLAMLRHLGWREEDMRLLLVQDMARGGMEHAVLWVRQRDGVIYLLDNQSHGLLKADEQKRYLPRYGMNALGFWRY